MFSDKKFFAILRIVSDNIRKSFSWLFYSGLGIYTFVFFSALHQKNRILDIGIEYTCADVFTECLSKYYVYLFFLPLGLFIRQRIIGNSENIQLYLRYRKRSSIWKNNVLYSIIISFIYSFIIIVVIYISSLMLCRTAINWNTINSVYYMSCGDTNEQINFVEIILISFLYLYITMLSVNIVMQIAEVYSKVFGWLLVIVYIGLNMRGPLAFCRYNIDYLSYNNIWQFLLLQFIKIIVAVSAYFAGKIIIRKKDFYE